MIVRLSGATLKSSEMGWYGRQARKTARYLERGLGSGQRPPPPGQEEGRAAEGDHAHAARDGGVLLRVHGRGRRALEKRALLVTSNRDY